MALIRAKTRWTGGLRGDGWATPEYYGAKPGTTFDSLPAILAAISDLSGQGAELRFGPYAYRVDGTIAGAAGVSMRGVPHATFIHGNHATLPLFAPAAGTARNSFTEVTGIGFGSLIGATGAAILNGQTNQRWLFRNCSWNWGGNRGAPNLNGPIFNDNSSANTGCVYQFEDCWAKSNRDGQVFTLATTGSALNFYSSKMVWPVTTGSAFIYYALGTGIIDGLEFDASAHTTGANAQCISVSSVTADPILISNVKAFASGGPVKTVLGADSNTFIKCQNLSSPGFTRYAVGTLAIGSQLELEPALAIDIGSAPTLDLTNTRHYASILVKGDVACVVTLPTGMFPGQVLRYTHYCTGLFNVTFAGTPLTGNALTNPIGAGVALTTTLVWESRDVSSTYRWVQKGNWGYGGTLV